MMITVKPVEIENFWDVIDLKVGAAQNKYVFDNVLLLAQAAVQPECIPLAVYAHDALVGFVMYGIDRGDGNYWIYNLMIDKKHQGNGYAKEALEKILAEIKKDTGHTKILLAVNKDNTGAIALYRQFGFAWTGGQFGEHAGATQVYREFFRRTKEKEIIEEYIMELRY